MNQNPIPIPQLGAATALVQLAEILARAEAATPGPWCTDDWEIYQGTEYEPGMSAWIGETCRGTSTPEQDRADAEFVAAARTDVPELVAAVQLLTAEVAGLRARVAELKAAPLAWAEELNAKSLDNFLIALGSATEYEPMSGAIDRIHELVRSYHEAAPSSGELAEQRHLVDPLEHLADERVPGACDACGDAPSAWCPDCGACRKGCHNGHDGLCTHPNAPWAVAS